MPPDRKRVAAGKRAKSKGNNFERKAAARLQAWWQDVDSGVEFARTPMSGGSALKDGWRLCGDVVCSDPNFPFTVECKNQEGWTLDQLFLNTGVVLSEWWFQAKTECHPGTSPLLIFTRNHRPEYVMLRYQDDLIPHTILSDAHFMLMNFEDEELPLLVMLLKDFIQLDARLFLASDA